MSIMLPQMRTTLDLDDELMRTVKRKAAERKTTMTAIVEEALRESLGRGTRPSEKPFKLAWVTVEGRLLPGVDLADRDALYERMEGRR